MMVHIAMVIGENGSILHYGDSLEILQSEVDGTLEHWNRNAKVHLSTEDDEVFMHRFNNAFGDTRAFKDPKAALTEWVLEEMSAQEVIKEIDDAEDECKKFLEDKDYVIYEDEDDAVDRLSDQAFAKIGGSNVIHAQYAGDAMEKVSEYVAKHGWLKLLNLVEAAL